MPQAHISEALQFSGVPVTVEHSSGWSHSWEYLRASIFGLRSVLSDAQMRAWSAEAKRRAAVEEEREAQAKKQAQQVNAKVKVAKAAYRTYLEQLEAA